MQEKKESLTWHDLTELYDKLSIPPISVYVVSHLKKGVDEDEAKYLRESGCPEDLVKECMKDVEILVLNCEAKGCDGIRYHTRLTSRKIKSCERPHHPVLMDEIIDGLTDALNASLKTLARKTYERNAPCDQTKKS